MERPNRPSQVTRERSLGCPNRTSCADYLSLASIFVGYKEFLLEYLLHCTPYVPESIIMLSNLRAFSWIAIVNQNLITRA